MKNRKKTIYLLAFIAPIVIFFITATLAKRLPVFNEIFQVFDARHQYPGFFAELITRIKEGNLFYSFNGGLGTNFFGTFTYYLSSPLNLLVFFFNAKTLTIFFSLIVYLRIGLSGLTMAIYLYNQDEKKHPKWIIAFSSIFALMGFLSLYYYNFMWIDTIIMVPLVMLGIDKLFKTGNPYFYIISLSLSIIFNYYIGIMVCIFSVIYFIYRLFSFEKYNFKKVLIKFTWTSICAGAIGAIIILPTVFSLMNGKATIYGADWINYFETTDNAISFWHQLLPASYKNGDQAYGPAAIYSSIFAYVLVILFFFNKKFKLKEKIAVGLILIFFYLSFSITGLDYAWQLFQKPIWWQSRYSFTFSTFMIIIAYKCFINIDKVEIRKFIKIMISAVFLILTSLSTYYVISNYNGDISLSSYLFVGFGILFFIQLVFLIQEKNVDWYFLILILLELTLNSYNSLRTTSYNNTYKYIYNNVAENEKAIEYIKKLDDSFYRMELTVLNTNNDGMLHNYKGINVFNSNRNQKAMNFLRDKLGVTVDSGCGVKLKQFHQPLLSLLNIKYLVGDLDYFDKVYDNDKKSVYENKYPLSLGFMISNKYEDPKLVNNNALNNYEKIYSAFTDNDVKLYNNVDFNSLITVYDNVKAIMENGSIQYKVIDSNNTASMTIKYTAKQDSILIHDKKFGNIESALINDNKYTLTELGQIYLNKDDVLELKYSVTTDSDKSIYTFKVLDLKVYEEIMDNLNKNLFEIKNSSKHLIEGTVTSTKDKNILFTSIPYEDGFTIKVDGKKVTPIIILDTFIGIKLEEGTHTITIDYISKGFIPGLLISLSGITIITTYYFIDKRKGKKYEVKYNNTLS